MYSMVSSRRVTWEIPASLSALLEDRNSGSLTPKASARQAGELLCLFAKVLGSLNPVKTTELKPKQDVYRGLVLRFENLNPGENA